MNRHIFVLADLMANNSLMSAIFLKQRLVA